MNVVTTLGVTITCSPLSRLATWCLFAISTHSHKEAALTLNDKQLRLNATAMLRGRPDQFTNGTIRSFKRGLQERAGT